MAQKRILFPVDSKLGTGCHLQQWDGRLFIEDRERQSRREEENMNAGTEKNLEILISYFTGTLDYDEYIRVDEHVSQCASCQRLLEHLRKVNANILRKELEAQNSSSQYVHGVSIGSRGR